VKSYIRRAAPFRKGRDGYRVLVVKLADSDPTCRSFKKKARGFRLTGFFWGEVVSHVDVPGA